MTVDQTIAGVARSNPERPLRLQPDARQDFALYELAVGVGVDALAGNGLHEAAYPVPRRSPPIRFLYGIRKAGRAAN